jgi:hypothetical protein
MSFPWYVVTGDITLENFNKMRTYERHFIWRGYTHEYEMRPSAANYNRFGVKTTDFRTENCSPFAEIQRVAEKIYALNKLQKFPFEIPAFVRKVLFAPFIQSEHILFKEMGVNYFPDNSLAQAMSIVQHEFGGTSLLDFSSNQYKALYFAIGKEDNYCNDSYLFGLNIPYLETHKDYFVKELHTCIGEQFDILYPSYFMNNKIAHQEGVFLYQKFEINDFGDITGSKEYENIIDYFHFAASGKMSNENFKEISLYDFLKIVFQEIEQENGQKGGLPVFYFLLKVPAKDKLWLKSFLYSVGITDNFMMGEAKT